MQFYDNNTSKLTDLLSTHYVYKHTHKNYYLWILFNLLTFSAQTPRKILWGLQAISRPSLPPIKQKV